MLSGYVSKVRREEENTIYCIAGDMFRGSVIDSEFRVIYNKNDHDFCELTLDGMPIEEEKVYKIGLQYYFYLNTMDFFSVSHEEVAEIAKPRRVATSCREVLDEYVSSHQNLDHSISGRLRIE